MTSRYVLKAASTSFWASGFTTFPAFDTACSLTPCFSFVSTSSSKIVSSTSGLTGLLPWTSMAYSSLGSACSLDISFLTATGTLFAPVAFTTTGASIPSSEGPSPSEYSIACLTFTVYSTSWVVFLTRRLLGAVGALIDSGVDGSTSLNLLLVPMIEAP
jgi:hypothetical protein